MFEKASRAQLRFNTPNGKLTTEDLWELPLTSSDPTKANLDDIAKELYAAIKEGDTVSFVNSPAKADDELRLKFNIVKHIIDTLLAERDANVKAVADKQRRQQISKLIADKELEELGKRSVEELRSML